MAFEDPGRDEKYYLALNPSYFFCDGKTVDKKWFAIDLSILWNKLNDDGWDGVLSPNALAAISDLGQYVSTLRVWSFRSVLERFVLINSSQVFPHCLTAGTFRPQIPSRAALAPAVLRTDFRNPSKTNPKFSAQIMKDEAMWKQVEDLPSSVLSCYPSLIAGPSGSGKSVAAHQLTELFVKRLKASVFSVCILPSHLLVGQRKLARENTSDLFSAIAIAVVGTIRRSLHIFGDYPRNVDDVFMHCILDEMGSHPEWVYAIVSDSAAAAAEINRHLQLAKFEGSLTVHFTIVGTGVGGRSGSVGSIGLPYWRLEVMTKPEEAQQACFNYRPANRGYPAPETFDSKTMMASIMKSPLLSILSTNMRCAVIIAQSLCEFGHFASDLSPIAACVAKSTAEDYMQMNAWRLLSASGTDGLQKYISLLVSLFFTQRHGVHILEDKDILMLHCELGAMEDLLEWGDEDKGVRIPDCDSLYSASDSSGKGRGISNNAAHEAGRFKLLISKPSGVTKDASEKAKSKSFLYFRKPQGAEAKEWDTNTHIRFAISPAVVLVALLLAAELDQVVLFSSDSQTPSVTNERLCSLTIRLLLGALEGAGISRFPASMLFADCAANPKKAGRRASDALDRCVIERIRAKNKLPHAYIPPAVQVAFDEAEAARSSPRDTVLAMSVKTLRSMKFGKTPTVPFVVEEAPPFGAQSDLLLHSASTTLGVEQNLCTAGSVRAMDLVRRACQMGYDTVEFTVPFIELVEAPVAKKHTKGVSPPDEGEQGGRLFVSKAVRLFFQDVEIRRNFVSIVTVNGEPRAKISICTQSYHSSVENSLAAVRSMVLSVPPAKRAALPARPADMVVLCSPRDNLLPNGFAVEFVGKQRVSSGAISVCSLLSKQRKALRKTEYADDKRKKTVEHVEPVEVKYTVDGSVRCSVVSRTVSLERLLASSWLSAESVYEAQTLTVESEGWHSYRHCENSQSLAFCVEKDHFLSILPANTEQNRTVNFKGDAAMSDE